MAKPAIAEVSAEELEKVAQELGLNKLYDNFYVKKSDSKFMKHCDELDDLDKTHKGVKEICIKLVSSLEKLAEIGKNKKEYYDYCNYLPYWLFDEIGKIYKPGPSKKYDTIPFYDKLVDIANRVNGKNLQKGCNTLPSRNHVSLDERKNRKNSYIYLKKYEEINQIINAKGKGKCDLYIKYLNYIESLNKRYKEDDCIIFSLLTTPNYADCDSKHDPNNLISILNECKDTNSARGGSKNSEWWFLSLFGSSSGSSRSSKDGAPAGAAKAGSTAGDNVRQESSKNLVGTGDSPGLTRSTSLGGLGRHVEARGSSFSSVAAAGVRTLGKLATTVLKGPLIPTIGKITGHVAHAPSFYNLRRRWNKLLDSTVNTRGIFGSIYGKLSSNFIRNIIMASAIFGTFFFIFCYNMSYGLKSGSPKRKRKKKIFEHNYYEEYEKELEKYDSQNESLDSQEDRYYLNYQPERYYYY